MTLAIGILAIAFYYVQGQSNGPRPLPRVFMAALPENF